MGGILVTGFEPFLDWRINPTALLAEALHGRELAGQRVTGAVLPVAFGPADAAMDGLIDRVAPAAVIGFGLHGLIDEIRLERVALNIDEAASPDNAGTLRSGAPIEPDAPVGYWSTLPLDGLAARLRGAGLPVAMSRDAGGFLCNHVFYRARHRIETRGARVPCGFIHVPPLPEQVAGQAGRRGLAFDRLEQAALLVLETVAEGLAGAAIGS